MTGNLPPRNPQGGQAPSAQGEDLGRAVFFGGPIHTLAGPAGDSPVEAVGVWGGRIAAAGSRAEVERALTTADGGRPRPVDLQGRALFPLRGLPYAHRELRPAPEPGRSRRGDFARGSLREGRPRRPGSPQGPVGPGRRLQQEPLAGEELPDPGRPRPGGPRQPRGPLLQGRSHSLAQLGGPAPGRGHPRDARPARRGDRARRLGRANGHPQGEGRRVRSQSRRPAVSRGIRGLPGAGRRRGGGQGHRRRARHGGARVVQGPPDARRRRTTHPQGLDIPP